MEKTAKKVIKHSTLNGGMRREPMLATEKVDSLRIIEMRKHRHTADTTKHHYDAALDEIVPLGIVSESLYSGYNLEHYLWN